MQLLNLHNIIEQKQWIDKIRACDWSAAKFLANLLEQDKFHEVLGEGNLFLMVEEENVVAFCTLTRKDCIDDDSLFPWIGFVFTSQEYRGQRYSGVVIDYACNKAKEQGFDTVYLATDHIGLYEKYGFSYIESRMDVYNEMSRIYCRKLIANKRKKEYYEHKRDVTGGHPGVRRYSVQRI